MVGGEELLEVSTIAADVEDAAFEKISEASGDVFGAALAFGEPDVFDGDLFDGCDGLGHVRFLMGLERLMKIVRLLAVRVIGGWGSRDSD